MSLLAVDDADRTFVSVPVAVVAACAALVLGAGTALWIDDDGDGRDRPAGSPSAACEQALLRADEAVAAAELVDEALAAHTTVVDDLLAGRVDAREAGARAAPVLTEGAQHSVELDVAVQRYEAVARECRAADR